MFGSSSVALAGRTEPVRVPQGAVLRIAGWAVDRTARRPVSAVFTMIGGHPVVARMGDVRDDVASALGDPRYANAGFELDLPTTDFPAGRFDVALRATNAGGTGYGELRPPIRLLVTR